MLFLYPPEICPPPQTHTITLKEGHSHQSIFFAFCPNPFE
jgi:hypothetical protein